MRIFHRLAAAALALIALPAASPPPESAPAPVAVSSAPDGPPVAPARRARPALWKVADADTTIYLFGTIHALPEGVSWYDGAIKAAFERSGELVTEIVRPEPAQMQALILAKARLPQGKTLRKQMTPEDRAGYEAALAGLGLPLDAFDAFEPWYAAIGLATLPLARDGFATRYGVEETLDARAQALRQRHVALETAEYQLGLFDALPPDAQERYLNQVVAQLPTIKTQLGRMVAAWEAGDADLLAGLINEENDDPVLLRTLLTDRNRAWAGWIRKRMDSPGTVFLAVGAGHLAGSGSVQDQLAGLGLPAQRLQ